MGFLDANVPQMHTSSSSFADQAALMRSTIAQAESTAMEAQAYHQGESSIAFQSAHARFAEAAAKANVLLDQAGQNINEGGTSYTIGDQTGASDMNTAAAAVPTGNV
ncbi:MAG: WXG100 family type VII secretion target [Actinomycetia bacterium]|nr:WXG100 family type VII secretion target [Actinomycetes bacterium]